jgi:membrane-bound lytic murein transglycosylase A
MPGRSIAIDRALHAYGTPFFIQAELPIANQKTGTKFDRLMIAQDTGSAIVGPARADIYFGAGDEAARIAGRIKNPGTFVMLVPRELDPVAAASDVPLPLPRPGLFSFNFDSMPDPTVPDSATDEVPLPESKPVASPVSAAGASAAPSTNSKSSVRRRR